MCELTLAAGPGGLAARQRCDAVGGQAAVATGELMPGPKRAASRASDQGYLPIRLDKYLSLLDWTGRELRAGSRATIPAQLAPILERLGVNTDGWVETVRHFGRWFKTAVGRRESLIQLAER